MSESHGYGLAVPQNPIDVSYHPTDDPFTAWYDGTTFAGTLGTARWNNDSNNENVSGDSSYDFTTHVGSSTLTATTVNGKPAVNFVGNGAIRTASAKTDTNKAFSFYWVGQVSDITNAQYMIANTAAFQRAVLLKASGHEINAWRYATAGLGAITTYTIEVDTVYAIIADFNTDGSISVHLGNIETDTKAGNDSTRGWGAVGYRGNSSSDYFKGDMCALGLRDVVTTAQERSNFFNWAKSEYNAKIEPDAR